MSIKLMNLVWELPGVDGRELLVMLALADYANDDGMCWPSMGRVADRARLTVRGARKVVARLEERGLLERSEVRGRGRSNLFVLRIPEHGSAFEKPEHGSAPERSSPFQKKKPERESTENRNKLVPPEPPLEPSDGDDDRASEVDRIREAAGIDPAKRLPQSWLDPWVEGELARWRSLPGLTFDEMLAVVRAVTAQKGSAPSSPSYFARAMQEAAGRKQAPKLEPIEGGRSRSPDIPKIDINAILEARNAGR